MRNLPFLKLLLAEVRQLVNRIGKYRKYAQSIAVLGDCTSPYRLMMTHRDA